MRGLPEIELPPRARSLSAGIGRAGRNPWPPLLILAVLVVSFAWRFSALVVQRHNGFLSFDYDLGIYDQGIYLLGHGRQFLTVRGLRFLGHHWNPATVLFVPAYWLGAGPNLLDVSQALAVSVAAVPVFLGTRKLTRSGWIALIVASVYLFHPSTGFLIEELFHPETMAIPFVLGAWALAEHERWRWYAAFVVGALLWKEDVALATAMLGLAVVWRKNRRYGLLTFGGSVAYFFAATKLFIPAILGRAPFYEELFGRLGSSMSELARNAVLHPMRVYGVLKDHQAETYAHHILRPFGYIGLLSPTSLLIGLPQYLVNLLSTLSFIWDPKYHYIAMPLVGATVAAGRAIANRSTRWARWAMALIAAASSFGVRNTGVGPWSTQFNEGYWATAEQPRVPAYRRALAVVPNDPRIVTSSPYFFTPHLTHRYEAYTFPNPWVATLWGVKQENARDPRRVDYMITDESVMGTGHLKIYNDVVVHSTLFGEVFREGSVVVWKRIADRLHPYPTGVASPPTIVPLTAAAPPTGAVRPGNVTAGVAAAVTPSSGAVIRPVRSSHPRRGASSSAVTR